MTSQRVAVVLCLSVLSCCCGTPTHAEFLAYTQPPQFPGAIGSSWTTDYGLDGATPRGFQTYDNFTLAGTADLTRFTWQVYYLDFQVPGNNPVAPDTNSWEVSIWSNSATGTPGTRLFLDTQPAAQVASTFAGFTTTSNGQAPVYNLSFTLTNPFTALAGVAYWISPLSLSTNFNPIASWTSGTGGNGQSFQQTLGNNRTVTASTFRPGDRTFSLFAVPEPPGALMLGMGVLVLAGYHGMCRRLG